MSKNLSRRDVLMGSAAAVAALATTKAAAETTPQRPRSPEEGKRLRLGIIGSGGKGWSGMQEAARFGEVLAICDIDARERSKALLEHPRADTFSDYREMLEAMRGKIDSVVISTPDHHHAIAAALSMKQGLHCYCEKPLTRTIWEARQLARIAKDKRVATQMGNQSTASNNMRSVAAQIRRGDFGRVKEIHLWTDRAGGWWPQGVDRPAPAKTPKLVDFEQWIGPQPERPYAEGYHPFAWRGWWDFGTGSLGDMGCHIFNMPFMALDLRDPIAVSAKTSGHNRDSFPTWAIVHYEFGERNGRAPVDLFWYDGGKRPEASLVPGKEFGGNGVIVVCEKATIYSPDESNTNFYITNPVKFPEVTYEKSPGHMAEFARAAQGGPQAMSNFPNYAGPLTETVLLGNLAIWADGPRLEWDARGMRVKGKPEYDVLIRPKYRPGWAL